MSTLSIVNIFLLFCGLALFLYGMQQGEKNLKRLGGSDLKKAINIITRHRLSAYFAGFFTTMLTQSSSATTVMLVGLASSRLMTFGQSLGMILGSDLGTTFTVQLFAFKFHQIAPALIAVGFFSSTSAKSQRLADYGNLILAFGFIFFGMNLMAEAVTPLRTFPPFEHALLISFKNPWWGIVTGTLFTAIIQSSAATLAITIALAESFTNQGWTPSAAQLLPLILGANLGTCATAFISTYKADVEGVRVAWAHFFFKLLGSALVLPAIWILPQFPHLFNGSPAFQIAALHTTFNLVISAVFLPALHPFEQLILHITRKSKNDVKQKYHLTFIQEKAITLPILALSQATNEICRMSQRVECMNESCARLIEHFDQKTASEILEKDNEVDFLHEQIVTFLTRLAHDALTQEQAKRTYQLIMVTTDIEHIGDIISKRIVELADKIASSPLPLSPEGKEEISRLFKLTVGRFKEVMAAFTMNDEQMARGVFEHKRESRALFEDFLSRHLDRLYKRKPESLQTTSIHVDLLEEIQRINHFSFRIAAHILEIHRAE